MIILRAVQEEDYKPYLSLIKRCALVLGLWLMASPTWAALQLTLVWDANQEPDLAGYRVFVRQLGQTYAYDAPLWEGSATQCTVTIVDESLAHFFVVRAFDTQGFESADSDEVIYWPGGQPTDVDGDGITDDIDLFPFDPFEAFDTDGDGIGNNADSDDDNDLMPDQWELQYGLNPLVWDASADADRDGASNLAEFYAGTNPNPAFTNLPPSAPEAVFPADQATDISLTTWLETAAFFDPDAEDSHAQTQWQVYRAVDGVCVLDITSDVFLTDLDVPYMVLQEDQRYYWRARHFDRYGASSGWSVEVEFLTRTIGRDLNFNGIPDTQEVPDTTDLNVDGIPDNSQTQLVKSIVATDGGTLIALDATEDPDVIEIVALDTVRPDTVTDYYGRPENMPIGLIAYQLQIRNPGGTVAVAVCLSEPAPDDATWFKYDIINGWDDYRDESDINADRDVVWVLLRDGGRGDSDGVANGLITDPAGLGIVPQMASSGAVVTVSGGSGGGGGGCFIATSADSFWGNWHIKVLSAFRDQQLLNSSWGRSVIRGYYRHAPTAAAFLAKYPGLKKSLLVGLVPISGAAWSVLKLGWLLFCSLMVLTIASGILAVKCIRETHFCRSNHPDV